MLGTWWATSLMWDCYLPREQRSINQHGLVWSILLSFSEAPPPFSSCRSDLSISYTPPSDSRPGALSSWSSTAKWVSPLSSFNSSLFSLLRRMTRAGVILVEAVCSKFTVASLQLWCVRSWKTTPTFSNLCSRINENVNTPPRCDHTVIYFQ